MVALVGSEKGESAYLRLWLLHHTLEEYVQQRGETRNTRYHDSLRIVGQFQERDVVS
jgi:hypothetical protein